MDKNIFIFHAKIVYLSYKICKNRCGPRTPGPHRKVWPAYLQDELSVLGEPILVFIHLDIPQLVAEEDGTTGVP